MVGYYVNPHIKSFSARTKCNVTSGFINLLQEFDAETTGGGSAAKRRKLDVGESLESPAPQAPMISKSQTVNPTTLVEEDGKPWYDGCEYQVQHNHYKLPSVCFMRDAVKF